jgi:hypothetical protein
MYDHDGDGSDGSDGGTAPLTGTFDCVDPTVCSHQRIEDNADTTGVNEEEVTAISGYKFTGTGTTDAMPAMDDATYLAFGIWLKETVAEATNTYSFGAFRAGGDAVDNDDTVAGMIGTATYNGKAAGVHSMAGVDSTNDRVDFFSGDVTLNANFGALDVGTDGVRETADDQLGSVTGVISNIYAGGDPVGHNIYLDVLDLDRGDDVTPNNITATGAFAGRARMGTGKLGPDGEQDYPFNGRWNGQFYNPVADVAATTTVDESRNPPISAAGTFGVTNTNTMGTTADTDDDITESYIGAFGAHRDED